MRSFLQKWDFICAAIIAGSGAYFLPYDAVKDITTELIAFFSIQSAVILPAMIFTAGILKPDGLELKEAERYHRALKNQMLFWVVLLGLDFVAVASLISGKALGWHLEVIIPGVETEIQLGWLFPSLLYFSGSLAVLRTIPFVRGVLSLLDLNSEMAQKAIKRRNRLETEQRRGKLDQAPMELPSGYGLVVTPPNGENPPSDEKP